MSDTTMVALLAAAMLLRLGQGLYGAGVVRSKNAAAEVMRAICDLAIAALAFWAIGGAILMQQHNGLFAIDLQQLVGRGHEDHLLLYLVLILLGTGAFSAAVAERARFVVTCAASLLLAGVIMAIAGKWVWNGGWLADMGFVDRAGATVLHVSVGAAALVAAMLVGPRAGKYNRDRSANFIPGHSLVLKQIGVIMMLIGFVPYVTAATWRHIGHSASDTAMNVLLAAAAGAAVSLLIGRARYGKPDILLTCSGLIGGAVAMTAGAGTVSSLSAVIIGGVAGALVPAAVIFIDLRLRIDDAGSIAAMHGVGGAWGALAAAIFAPLPWSERFQLIGVQLLGVITIGVMSLIIIGGAMALLRATIGIRATEADEFDGLDLAEHDVNAYPDFQQTTIKSYHLREA